MVGDRYTLVSKKGMSLKRGFLLMNDGRGV